MKTIKILISACLASKRVRYDGRCLDIEDPVIAAWIRKHQVVPVCPEVLGGLAVPRPPAELTGGATAAAVISGKGQIRTAAGLDVTAAFLNGAARALEMARREGVVMAVFKEKSPSCGRHRVYDGTFSGTLTPGQGVTTRLLLENGIPVFSDRETHLAMQYLEGGAAAIRRGTGCFSHPH